MLANGRLDSRPPPTSRRRTSKHGKPPGGIVRAQHSCVVHATITRVSVASTATLPSRTSLVVGIGVAGERDLAQQRGGGRGVVECVKRDLAGAFDGDEEMILVKRDVRVEDRADPLGVVGGDDRRRSTADIERAVRDGLGGRLPIARDERAPGERGYRAPVPGELRRRPNRCEEGDHCR